MSQQSEVNPSDWSSKAVIPTPAYHDAAVFATEMTAIFQRSWIFVGFTDDLSRDNDFVTAEVGGVSVVVQNFGGSLRALRNICTHRFAKIQLEPCGNRKLTCPYHGWVFNRDGMLIGVPGNKEYFGLEKADRERLALDQFEVAVRGRFVFVRIIPGGPDLDTWLGGHGDVLDHLSAFFTDKIAEDTIPWAANWKIGVETVLEIYHVEATHPETFKKYAKKNIWVCSYEGDHSRGVAHLSDNSFKWWESVRLKTGLPRSDKYNNYDHFFVFPNLAIGINHGCLMSVQTYDPYSPSECGLHYRLFLGETSKPKTKGGPVRRAIEENLTSFNVTVLNEDRVVGEACQAGVQQMRQNAVVGLAEERIHAFHAAYSHAMPSSGNHP